MKGPQISVNLSNTPFERDRPVLIASAVIAVLLIATLILQIKVIRNERAAARENRLELSKLEQQIERLNRDAAATTKALRQPSNMALLDRGEFFNLLIQRKAISWTRMFSDLEGVFPSSVRLVSVRPYLTGDGKVQLDMIVGSSSPEPVIQLVRQLEGSSVFGATALLSSQPPSQNEPLYRYRVSVSYAQKL